MEEQKKSNEVKLGVVKGAEQEVPEGKRYTYEQLDGICGKLYQENQYLKRQLQGAEQAMITKRMDYLFKVVECANNNCDSNTIYRFDSDFVAKCINEIQEMLTIPEEEKTKEE